MTTFPGPVPESVQRANDELVTDIDADAAEINKLDGMDSTEAELELVDDQVANVTFSPAAGGANVCEITYTLKDAAGETIASPRPLLFWLSDAATGAGLTATTASGAVTHKAASGQDMGVLTTKKAILAQPLATGIGIISITDTAKTAFYPCIQLPNGKVVVGTQLITANYG